MKNILSVTIVSALALIGSVAAASAQAPVQLDCVELTPALQAVSVQQNVLVANQGFNLVTLRRPALKGFEGREGKVAVEFFDINPATVGASVPGHIQVMYKCTDGRRINTVSMKIQAAPPDVPSNSAEYRQYHVVEVPIPATFTGRLRWCSATENKCMDVNYQGPPKGEYLDLQPSADVPSVPIYRRSK